MEDLIERCAGIDVGQAKVVVRVRVPGRVTGKPTELLMPYGTTPPDLLELRDWLAGLGVTDVAMESTGCTGGLVARPEHCSGLRALRP